MKHYRKIIVVAIGLLVVFGIAYYKGLFYKFNFITAYYDILTKDYKIAYWGESRICELQEFEVARQLGFEIDRTYNCLVNDAIVNGIEDYNRIMGQYIEKHICSEWESKLKSKAEKDYIRESLLLSIVKSRWQLNHKANEHTEPIFFVDKRNSVVYELGGYTYSESTDGLVKSVEVGVDTMSKKIIYWKRLSIN